MAKLQQKPSIWGQRGTSADKVEVGEVGEFFKQKLAEKGINFEGNKLTLSWKTINDHRSGGSGRANIHDEIAPFEYSLVPFMFEESAVLGIFQDETRTRFNGDLYIVASKFDRTFRLTINGKKDGSVKISSLLSDENTLKNIHADNKRRIYMTKEVEKQFKEWDNE